ncbi:hypothetical protein D1006_37770 [Burkholderia stabilis]|uniref:Uncharacterized protein n=1 Tax=Burkholderia stabilis TaxID=95485 RepID=A0A4Q2A9I2_9BURK|nr:hypothetical protein [Burkholderia stabilis]RXV65765.1 hypothetical protein D1006_37770 [Burkholderia stabilis]
MSRISHNPYAAAQDGLAQAEQARADRARDDTRATHQAALYRGRTTFTHAHRASAKLLANKLRAAKLRARLAQARRKNAGKRASFAMSRKALAQAPRQAGSSGATRRAMPKSLSGLRVSRDGGRGGQRGGGERQSSQQDGKQQQQGRQQQRQEQDARRVPGKLRVAHRGTGAALPDDATLPDWLNDALDHETDGAREQAVADACCDELLAMRDELAAAPEQRLDARMYRVAREVTLARTWLGASGATGFEAVRARLVERSRLRGAAAAAEDARHANQSTLATEPVSRVRHFNLLLGLQLLALERPTVGSRATRADSILASLQAGASADRGDARDRQDDDAEPPPASPH